MTVVGALSLFFKCILTEVDRIECDSCEISTSSPYLATFLLSIPIRSYFFLVDFLKTKGSFQLPLYLNKKSFKPLLLTIMSSYSSLIRKCGGGSSDGAEVGRLGSLPQEISFPLRLFNLL